MNLQTKATVVQSQLGEAIKLFFERRDPVSIHALVGAAYQIMRDVANKNQIPYRCVIESMPRKGGVSENESYQAIFKPRNFFKHAYKDSHIALDFDPMENELWLFDACILYGQVFGKPFRPVDAYWAWYQCKHPETTEFLSVPAVSRLANVLKIEATDYEFFLDQCEERA